MKHGTINGRLQQVFDNFDEDGDGKISPSELLNCMRATGNDMTLEEAYEAVRYGDLEGDGLLELEDFVRLLSNEEEEQRERCLRDAFRVYTMDGWGSITAKSLKRALHQLGETKTMAECEEMVGKFDLDGDGVISYGEFGIMMMVVLDGDC